MPDVGRVPFVGLTGGVGSGKSTALAALSELGVATLSADAVVHELLDSEEVRRALVARFGTEVLHPDGSINRPELAARTFGHPEHHAWIEGMLWPRVGARIVQWRAEVDAMTPPPAAAVVEVPLLFESGMDSVFDTTVAVISDEGVRAERAEARGHTAVAERVGRQLSQQEKADQADHVVRNDGTREELQRELSRVLATIEA